MRSRIRRLFAFKVASLVGVKKRDDRFSTAVKYLLERDIPLLVIYGDDDFRVDFQSELEHGLGSAIQQAGARARLIDIEERLDGLALRSAQDALLKSVVEWSNDLAAGEFEPEEPSPDQRSETARQRAAGGF
jgi:hypothetical protein